MRVRLNPSAAKAVRTTAKAEKRTHPQQASVLVLRGADLPSADEMNRMAFASCDRILHGTGLTHTNVKKFEK